MAGKPKEQKDMKTWKPGSEPEKPPESPGDFGVPEGSGPSPDRQYASENTKMSDPGNAQPSSNEFDALRTSGAGSKHSGTGAGSGGDVDTDIIGVGTGGSGVSQAGPGEPPGPDDTDGTSRSAASGPPAQGHKPAKTQMKGTTISSEPDTQSGAKGSGADSANNPARGDDASAGEVSADEASGGEGG